MQLVFGIENIENKTTTLKNYIFKNYPFIVKKSGKNRLEDSNDIYDIYGAEKCPPPPWERSRENPVHHDQNVLPRKTDRATVPERQ